MWSLIGLSGAIWGLFDPRLDILEPIWVYLGQFGVSLNPFRPFLGAFGAYLDLFGPMWGNQGPFWSFFSLFGPMLSSMYEWIMVRASLQKHKRKGTDQNLRLGVEFLWRVPHYTVKSDTLKLVDISTSFKVSLFTV